MTSTSGPNDSSSWLAAYRLAGEPWSDPDLARRFKESDDESDPAHWALIRWTQSRPEEDGLTVHLSAPNPDTDLTTQLKLADLVKQKLGNGFAQSSAEKGWPLPRFRIVPADHGDQEHWTYRLHLGNHTSAPVVIYPNKILAVGEEGPLSALLGLECVDPVFGLPAKWVTYSQTERATDGGCLLFESSEVIMSHAIAFTEARASLAVHQWEVMRWVSRGLPALAPRAIESVTGRQAFLNTLVRQFIRENLHLPSPEVFLETLLSAESVAESDAKRVPADLRKAVVGHNLNRWRGEHQQIIGIEWDGPPDSNPEEHQRMLVRLSHALEDLSHHPDGSTPILLVEAEQREGLVGALSGLYPELPIVAWSELDDVSEVVVAARISPELAIEPSVLPAAFYHIQLP